MTRRRMVAGNWKMYKTVVETRTFCRALADLKPPTDRVDVAVFPPFVDLPVAIEALAGSGVGVGAQNMHPAPEGAYTGEVSASMLLTLGCQYVIIGHSERRALFDESDDFIREKVVAAFAAGLCPLLCVGETLEQREAKQTEAVVSTQLTAAIGHLNAPADLVVAYEPVWAIGTGRTATPDQAQEVHAFVRAQLHGRFGSAADALRILYGGSVKPGNAGELLAQPDVDGALVGGASLEVESFMAIIEAAI
jgi:triosephosphate isomerase